MAAMKKIAGVIAGLSAVAVIGAAVAQSVPPNPFVTNHAVGAGQQSTHITWMGETGTPWGAAQRVETARVDVAPAPVIAAAPAPEIAPAAPVQEVQQMGAAPAAEPAPAPVERVARADRG